MTDKREVIPRQGLPTNREFVSPPPLLPLQSVRCSVRHAPPGQSGHSLTGECRLRKMNQPEDLGLLVIGQSNRQTLPRCATVYFQCFVLPSTPSMLLQYFLNWRRYGEMQDIRQDTTRLP
jgi:hypothetical protein